MIQEITLKPISGTLYTTLFTSKYFDKDTNQNVIVAHNGGNRYFVVLNRELNDTEREFRVWFGENQRDVTIRWDDNDTKTAEAVAALKRHPQVYTAGFDNTNRQGKPSFELVDSRAQQNDRFKLLKEKARVFNYVNNLDVSEIMDISFFVGHNPTGKLFTETFNTLLDFESGILMKSPEKFMEAWGANDQNIIVTVRKCIDLKIIASKDGKFYVGTEIVGDSADGVIAYMKVNDKLYEYIKRELSEKDVLPIDCNRGNIKAANFKSEPKETVVRTLQTPTEKADKKQKEEEQKTAEHDERAILKSKMKQYGMRGWQVMDQWSIEVCREKVLAEEQKRKAAVPA